MDIIFEQKDQYQNPKQKRVLKILGNLSKAKVYWFKRSKLLHVEFYEEVDY